VGTTVLITRDNHSNKLVAVPLGCVGVLIAAYLHAGIVRLASVFDTIFLKFYDRSLEVAEYHFVNASCFAGAG